MPQKTGKIDATTLFLPFRLLINVVAARRIRGRNAQILPPRGLSPVTSLELIRAVETNGSGGTLGRAVELLGMDLI